MKEKERGVNVLESSIRYNSFEVDDCICASFFFFFTCVWENLFGCVFSLSFCSSFCLHTFLRSNYAFGLALFLISRANCGTILFVSNGKENVFIGFLWKAHSGQVWIAFPNFMRVTSSQSILGKENISES